MRATATMRAGIGALLAIYTVTSLAFGLEALDQTQVALSRTAKQGFELSTRLSKNVYRYVDRVETYTEQVPYTVDVPYETDETYYTTERRCREAPRSRQVCHDETRCEDRPSRDCRQEQRCHNSLAGDLAFLMSTLNAEPVALASAARPGPVVPGGGRIDRGGGNSGGRSPQVPGSGGIGRGGGNSGGGGSSCSTVTICRDTSERVCNSVPVCSTQYYTETECRDIQIPHTRRVTRIRTETYYRTEQRERVVTDAIFDRAWGANVTVLFPEQAPLEGNEAEAVYVQLAGVEGAPDANVSVNSPVYSYRVYDKKRDGENIVVRMEMVAKYAPEDLGAKTVKGLALVRDNAAKYSIRFTDAGKAARTNTTYVAQLFDLDLNRTVFEKTLEGRIGDRDVVIPVEGGVEGHHDHQVRLIVRREGVVLSELVQFEAKTDILAQLDPKPFQDPRNVRDFTLTGVGQGAAIVFTDAVPPNPAAAPVHTTYEVVIKNRALGFLWKQVVAQGKFDKSKLVKLADRVSIPMAGLAGMNKEKLADLFKPGNGYYLEITVRRNSERLKGHNISFLKESEIRVPGGRKGS